MFGATAGARRLLAKTSQHCRTSSKYVTIASTSLRNPQAPQISSSLNFQLLELTTHLDYIHPTNMASISAPTSLATFPSPQASSSRVPHVTLVPVHGSKGRLAVAAVHGDGVWTYDIKTLRPTTSFTVPPSTVFACAPVSFEVEDKDRVTVVGVHAGEGLKGEGRSLWVWRGDDGEKRSVALNTAVQSVHGQEWPLLVVSSDGGLSLLDEELAVHSLAKGKGKARILAAGVSGSRATLVDERGRVSVFNLDAEGRRADLAVEAGLTKDHQLLAASVEDGIVTAIDNAHRVHSRRVSDLETLSEGVTLSHPSTPAAVVSLPSKGRPLALLAVSHPSSGIALVAPSQDAPAVLANTAVGTSDGAQVTNLAVISAAPRLVLGAVLKQPGANGRSAIYIADVTVPEGGVGLSLLLGSASLTADVFTSADAPSASQNTENMLDGVDKALKTGDVDRAERTFTSFLDEEDKRTAGRRAVLAEPVVRRLLDTVFSHALQDGKKSGPYASKIVNTLIDRKAVHDSMRSDGIVLGALVPCTDWRAITRLVRTNPSLPSRTTVSLLAASLKPESALRLTSTLDDILHGPSPDPAYRSELRRQLTPDDALRILTQLAIWAEKHAERGDGLASWPNRPEKAERIPPLSAVVSHTSHLLDAHLPTLMAMEEAEPLLQRVSEALAPALAAQGDYRRLRAPVDAALKSHRAAVREQEKADADKKRRAFRTPKAGIAEEAVGKWRVEDFVF